LDVKLLFRKVVQISRTAGFRGLLRSAFRNLRPDAKEDVFDAKYGTDTGGSLPLWKFHIASPNARHGLHYAASDQEDFGEALSSVQEDFHTFTFVDLGCGKGRTLILASKFGFQAIIGVEFVAELASVARANVTKMGIVNASVVHADAAKFSFPEGDLLLYLFNPFTEEVMRKVVANLQKCSWTERKLYIVYNNPLFAAVLDSSSFLRRFASPPTARYPTVVWRSNRAAGAA
jgi:SAM-dependent methyltransferase